MSRPRNRGGRSNVGLIENWHVVLWQMIAPTIRETRTEEDFAWHIHHTIQIDPEAGRVFVADNLNILNQIEIVFGIVGRRAVRGGNLNSVAALKQRLLDFIAYFNRTFAKPFR